jgi:transketolase
MLIATGSEVRLALAAADLLESEGVQVRVVSMPSWELFEAQLQAYRDSVLPPGVTRRISVEAGVSLGWARYVGPAGRTVSMDRFGASAPDEVLFEQFGFTPERVADAVRSTAG